MSLNVYLFRQKIYYYYCNNLKINDITTSCVYSKFLGTKKKLQFCLYDL